jgi:hypothetical protein
VVGIRVVADSNRRIEPNAHRLCERIIEMNEAAFGSFQVILGKRVGYASETKWLRWVLERSSIEYSCREVSPRKYTQRDKMAYRFRSNNSAQESLVLQLLLFVIPLS